MFIKVEKNYVNFYFIIYKLIRFKIIRFSFGVKNQFNNSKVNKSIFYLILESMKIYWLDHSLKFLKII